LKALNSQNNVQEAGAPNGEVEEDAEEGAPVRMSI